MNFIDPVETANVSGNAIVVVGDGAPPSLERQRIMLLSRDKLMMPAPPFSPCFETPTTNPKIKAPPTWFFTVAFQTKGGVMWR